MNSLFVKKSGLLTTVQDLGRPGYGTIGVSASGAADSTALRIGNRLVGNADDAAALEMTLLGGEFEFAHDTSISVTGSDFGATIGDTCVPMWQSVSVGAKQTIRLGPTRGGARCYLCAGGGIQTELVLGSRSTHLLSGLGGYQGRPLRKDDSLVIGERAGKSVKRALTERFRAQLSPRKTIRVTRGPQWDLLAQQAIETFFSEGYLVTEESNRMGIRLQGNSALSSVGEMISEGVSLGAIQVPSGGQPIILFVEQQTTGGYPILANVISADISSVGQLRPRDEIRFELVTLEVARTALIEQEQMLASPELIES